MLTQKPILYIHSRANIGQGLGKLGVKENFEKLFGDIAQLTFDENNGLIFQDFLERGEPKVYLTDWASSLHYLNPKPMYRIFDWIKTNHPAIKVAACDYLNLRAYEDYASTGKIDRLLKSAHLEILVNPQNNMDEDIATIRGLLKC